MPRQLRANQARTVLAGFTPTTPLHAPRHALALDHLDDFERIEAQLAEHRKRITEAVAAAGSAVSDLFGAGPIVTAMIIGYSGDVRRFTSRDHYASYNG